jgi:hypothetical protein
LPDSDIIDQYAYRTSGSTTAAIVDILHRVTKLLDTNKFVHCIFFDFSKVFDTINHPILFSKLQRLSLPPTVLAWAVNFLTGRTKFADDVTSIIQQHSDVSAADEVQHVRD